MKYDLEILKHANFEFGRIKAVLKIEPSGRQRGGSTRSWSRPRQHAAFQSRGNHSYRYLLMKHLLGSNASERREALSALVRLEYIYAMVGEKNLQMKKNTAPSASTSTRLCDLGDPWRLVCSASRQIA